MLQQWQTETPDKLLTDETFGILQKQLVSHPLTTAIRRFFSLVQASGRTIRANALKEKSIFTQDDRAMLQRWVIENLGKVTTNEDVKLLQRKMDINARLGQIWNYLVLLRRREAERHVATCSAADKMMLQQ